MELKDLAQKHDYHCGSGTDGQIFDNFDAFWSEWQNADIDLNLMYRWDLEKREDSSWADEDGSDYVLSMFFILQRKGNLFPVSIKNFEQKDVPIFVEWAKKHAEKLRQIWQPILL